MNLFASFAANNTLWLLWYRVVLGETMAHEPSIIERNEVSLYLFFFYLKEITILSCDKWYIITSFLVNFEILFIEA